MEAANGPITDANTSPATVASPAGAPVVLTRLDSSAVVDGPGCGQLIVAADRGHIGFSPRWARSMGWRSADPGAWVQIATHDALSSRGFESFEKALSKLDLEPEGRSEAILRFDSPERADRWMLMHLQRDARGAIGGIVIDVTEYRNAHVDLISSERRVREIYENTPAMLFSLDVYGRIVSVTDLWLLRLGYERADVVGRATTEFLTPDSSERLQKEVLPGLFVVGHCDRERLQAVCRDGSVIDIELSAIIERGETGHNWRCMAAVEDVTERNLMQRRAEASAHLVQKVIDNTPALVGHFDDQLRFQYVNAAWCRALQKEPAEIIGQTESGVTGAEPVFLTHDMVVALRVGSTIHQVVVIEQHDGVHEYETQVVADIGPHGEATGYYLSGADVTSRRQMERSIAESHELMRVTLESIGDAVVTTDRHGIVQWLNPVAERMTGLDTSDARGSAVSEVMHMIHEDTREAIENSVTRSLREQCVVKHNSGLVLVTRDGREFGVEDSAAPIFDAGGEVLGCVMVFRDVSEQRKMSREMNIRAKHDPLTGLVNRSEFELRILQSIERARVDRAVHSLLLLDLDRFKLVNDTCGHSAGDQLLRQVSDMMRDVVRTRDTVARLGGDEFGILLEYCTAADAEKIGQKICDRLDEFRFVHDEKRFRVGASVGLVQIDERWHDVPSLMNVADSACLAAKEGGRNRVHVWMDSDQAWQRRSGETHWASRIEDALDRNRFVLYAQRISTLSGEEPKGVHFETLIRMVGDEGNVIAPGAFLPVAERFHMASRIDRWVMKNVLRWAASLHDPDLVDTIAINVSGQSIGDRSFHRFATELITSSGVDPHKLCLEITETVAITNMADASTFIQQMRQHGVRVALDDFGAGASSFGYLKSLGVDVLKIDGQFIRDMVEDPLDNVAVRCFQEVARVVGVETVAEFVEREETLQALRELGVTYAQGYLVHRPEPLSTLLPEAVAHASARDDVRVAQPGQDPQIDLHPERRIPVESA